MNRIGIRMEGDAVFDLESHLGAEMIPEVLSYTRELMNDGYPKWLQLVFGADTREHEQLGRSDGPSAQHHTVGFDGEHLAPAFGFHADGPYILEHHLPDEHPAPHRQVQTVTHRLEMRDRRAHAHAVQVVRGRHAKASGVLAIRIRRGAEPRLHTGGMEGLLDGRPGPGLTAPDGQGSVRAMAIILHVEIMLRFSKVRQDLGIRPFLVAESSPGVKILGEAPLHGLPVD